MVNLSNKPIIKYSEFYITNVCNLTCQGCNRFNNFNFKGRHEFDKKLYQPWANKVDLKKFCILGGEPTLHPKLKDWMIGLAELWPNANKYITTNGTYWPSWIEKVAKKYRYTIIVNLHGETNGSLNKLVLEKLKHSFGPLETKKQVKKMGGLYLKSRLGVKLELFKTTDGFHKSAIKDESTLEVYDSNPEKAHKLCDMKKCHHFIDGKLWKCGVVKLLPEFLRQKNKTPHELFDKYSPLGHEDIDQKKINDLTENAIDQCRFCSDNKKDWERKAYKSDFKKNSRPIW